MKESLVAAVVAWSGLAGSLVCLGLGAWSAWQTLPKRRELLSALSPPKPVPPGDLPGPVTNQSLSTTVDSVAKLAVALKDLDRVAQLLTLSLGFLAVSAVAAGVADLARAVK
jgi:hypothetical protein